MAFFLEHPALIKPPDHKLGTLCEYFGVRLTDEDAHDAFNDVRATVELYRAIRGISSESTKLLRTE
jgi:DNA polymerase III epsilon subunit-like protein